MYTNLFVYYKYLKGKYITNNKHVHVTEQKDPFTLGI